jgi:6,7-dimethyl-8-ribityllumazine synthase
MSTELDAAIAVPKIDGPAPHILIVRAPYVTHVVDGLRDGAQALIAAVGGTFDVIDVAGALELAVAIQFAHQGPRQFDGYVALGCVIEGGTDHYEHVCREAMMGLTRVALDHSICVGNGVLTVNTEQQAIDRSGPGGHNKGAEAAAACVRQIGVARYLGAI